MYISHVFLLLCPFSPYFFCSIYATLPLLLSMNIETIDAAPLTFNLDHDRRLSISDSDSDLGYDPVTGHNTYHHHTNNNGYEDSDYHSKHSASSKAQEISREELDLYLTFLQEQRICHYIPPVGKRGLPPVAGTVVPETESYRANKYLLSFVIRKLGFKPRTETDVYNTNANSNNSWPLAGSGTVHTTNTNVSANTAAPTLHTRISSNPLSKFYKKVFNQATSHGAGASSSEGDHKISPSPSARSDKLLISLSSSSSSTSSHQGTPHHHVFRKSNPYLENFGTLQLRQSGTRIPFTVIIDPRFPHSFIDMDAIVRESSKFHDFDLLARAFKVVATPRYSPENPQNRVVIDIELIKVVTDDCTTGIGPPGSWMEASCDIITLMDIRPVNCILGKDWLNLLHRFTNGSTSPANGAFIPN